MEVGGQFFKTLNALMVKTLNLLKAFKVLNFKPMSEGDIWKSALSNQYFLKARL
jgi:hypothetical protein